VPERGNLFASLPGRSGRTALVLLSHTDVVPPGDLDQWTHAPFAGVVEDGLLHGRGAADMKGTAAAQAMTLTLLKRLGISLEHGVGFVCVADEEAGGAYGAGWAVAAHPERFRARCCLCEGGGSFVQLDGRHWCLLGVGEKGRYEVTATYRGRGAHAARPWQGDNAFFKAADALARLREYESERDTAAPIFDVLARARGPVTPANVDGVIAALAPAHARLADHLRQVSRLVITPTLISGGVKSNSVPDACRLVCDVRALPSQGPAYVAALAERLLAGADLNVDQTAVANQSEAPREMLAVFGDALRRAIGRDSEVVPTLSGGFTDSRFVRELGVPAYGFAPGHPESDPSTHRAHGPNESVAVVDLVVETATYLGIAHHLAAAS
jgi:acetylornithine deacetylase/succinyl-diaminopimelate desuccinylase-like protein